MYQRGWAGRALVGLVAVSLVSAAAAGGLARAAWHTNRATIALSIQELATWPTIGTVSDPEPALAELDAAIALDAGQTAARFRRGLLALNGGDYAAARADLERAYADAPDSRAVVKSLGYARLWSGDVEAAAILLKGLPEAQEELNAYVYYWESMSQPVLSEHARALAVLLEP